VVFFKLFSAEELPSDTHAKVPSLKGAL
jgi:hypothetical protein